MIAERGCNIVALIDSQSNNHDDDDDDDDDTWRLGDAWNGGPDRV